MEIAATLTSKGQLTVPKAVRDALGLKEGDQVIFRVLEGRAVVARSPSLLDLAGAVPVPAEVRGAAWSEIRRRARAGLYRGWLHGWTRMSSSGTSPVIRPRWREGPPVTSVRLRWASCW